MKTPLPKNTGKRTAKPQNALQFPIHRTLSCQMANLHLFEGMLLHVKCLEATHSLAVTAYYAGEHRIIGFIPRGMNHHLEPMLEDEENLRVELLRVNCPTLEKMIWISVTPLPELVDLGVVA